MADRLLDETAGWLWLGGRIPDQGDRTSRNAAFLERYEAVLPELLGPELPVEEAAVLAEGPPRPTTRPTNLQRPPRLPTRSTHDPPAPLPRAGARRRDRAARLAGRDP